MRVLGQRGQSQPASGRRPEAFSSEAECVRMKHQAQGPRLGIQGERGRFGMASEVIRPEAVKAVCTKDAEEATELRPTKIVSWGPAEAPTHILSDATGPGGTGGC